MEDAGLPWTPAMEARQAGYGISNAAAAVALRTVTRYIADSTSIKNVALSGGDPNADLVASVHADQELAAAGVATKMDETEVISRGYWELTKYLADKVVASLPAGQKLFISGHSQGGTRASLVAMYLKKSTGVAYPTVSFAGTGASCMSRLLYYSNGHLLADVGRKPEVQTCNLVQICFTTGEVPKAKDNCVSSPIRPITRTRLIQRTRTPISWSTHTRSTHGVTRCWARKLLAQRATLAPPASATVM
jgi:hypothetical protein